MPHDFQTFVAEKEEIRKQDLIESQNLTIKVKNEFIDIFRKSQAVSVMKGRSYFLTRMPRVTKDKQMIKALEEQKEGCNSKIIGLIKEIDSLREKIQQLEDSQLDNEKNVERLSNLYELGIIDENGNPTNDKMDYLS